MQSDVTLINIPVQIGLHSKGGEIKMHNHLRSNVWYFESHSTVIIGLMGVVNFIVLIPDLIVINTSSVKIG